MPELSHPVTIIVLARYWEVFHGFLRSAEMFAPKTPKILVLDPGGGFELGDSSAEGEFDASWTVIGGPAKFSMAGNANLGVKAAPPESDILYCGDDVRFTETSTVERLQAIAYRHPLVGILSPHLDGRASHALGHPQSACDRVVPSEMWFPCVYIKRELIAKIGYWDERFDSFGDDFDYSLRALLAGYELAVTDAVTVRHEAHVSGGPTTFMRRNGGEVAHKTATFEKLCAKYHVTSERLLEYFRTADLKCLGPRAAS